MKLSHRLLQAQLLLACFFILSACSSNSITDWVKPIEKEKKFFNPVWIKNMDVEHNTGNLPIGLQGPAINGGFLYIGHNAGSMQAFDVINGRKVWDKLENGPYHSAPIVTGKLVVYGNVAGRLFARDRYSGELVYNIDLGSAVEGSPTYFDGRLIVHTRNHKIVCLDALTGKILWAYKRNVPFLTTLQRVSRPIVHNNNVIVGFADGYVCSFSIEEGLLQWESKVILAKKFIDVDSEPVLFSNRLIVGGLSGQMSLMNPMNGLILRSLPYQISRAPLKDGKRLIVGTTEGELVELDSSFEKVRSIKISDEAITSIKKWKNHYVLGTTGGRLWAIKSDLSAKTSYFDFGHSSSSLFGDIEVNGDTLAAYSSRNRLYVFR